MAEPGMFTSVKYEPNIGTNSGIGIILKSTKMREFMATVAAHGETIARQYAPHAITISSEELMGNTRWTALVNNESANAMIEEYGAGKTTPKAPLGHVVQWFRDHDPNSHRPQLRRLLGR